MGEVLKIFISATSADLGAVREAARDFFNRHDQFKAREQQHRDLVPATLLENDQHHLEDCDAVLHIVGECYGEEPPAGAEPSEGSRGAEPGGRRAVVAGAGGRGGGLRTGGGGEGRGEGSRRSYTQREYDYAREHGKPLYLFICEEHFPYSEHESEPEEKQALQSAHRIAILKGDIKYERIADFAGLDTALGKIKLDSQRPAAELRDTRRSFEEVGRDLAGLREGITTIDPLQRYYQALLTEFADHDNVSLPVSTPEGKDETEEAIKIRALFVPPRCSKEYLKPAHVDAAVSKGETLGVPLLPLLQPPGTRIVLLGDPGMGKSTVLQYLIATLAEGQEPVDAPELRHAVPLPFVLRVLARSLPDDVEQWNWDALLDAFCRWNPGAEPHGSLAGPLTGDRFAFRTLLDEGRALFLIDGLDEIGDRTRRVAMNRVLWEGFERHPLARWIITSRLVGYEQAELHKRPLGDAVYDLPDGTVWNESEIFSHMADRLYLAPFDDAQQHLFARHWYVARMNASTGPKRAEKFISAVHQHDHLRVIGRVPNLLYLLALLYRHRQFLPNGRARVYAAISEAYLHNIPFERNQIEQGSAFARPLQTKEGLLAIVGLKMQQQRASQEEGEDGDILVSRAQLEEWLRPHFADDAELADFLEHVARHSGLLLPRGEGVYGFAHLSFQEYYAACHLQQDFDRIIAAKSGTGGGLRRRSAPAAEEHEERRFAEYAALPAWHEPLLFLIEKLSSSAPYTERLIEWMFPQFADDPAKGMDWMPFPAAQLLATLSVDPEVALDLEQRGDIWKLLWKADCAAWDERWRIAPWLVVAGSAFQHGVLQAAVTLSPQRLNLGNCAALFSLPPLAGLASLQKLNLYGCVSLTDLTALRGQTGLQALNLSHCTALGDFAPLSGLTSLLKLSLSGCTGLENLTPLAALIDLRELSLGGCAALCDLTPLAGLTRLQRLKLSDTSLNDISPLAGLTGLRHLNLNSCRALSDFTPLSGLSGLQSLDLNNCPALDNFTPLARLTGLRYLELGNCTGLGALTPLAGLTQLRTLNLSRCTGLGDLTALAGLTGLRRLFLNGCTGLGDFTTLAGLTGLKLLSLPRCSGLGQGEIAKLQKALPETKIYT